MRPARGWRGPRSQRGHQVDEDRFIGGDRVSPRLLKAAPLAAVAMLLVVAQGAAGAPQVASPARQAGLAPRRSRTGRCNPSRARAGFAAPRRRWVSAETRSHRRTRRTSSSSRRLLAGNRRVRSRGARPGRRRRGAQEHGVRDRRGRSRSTSSPNRCFRGGFWSVDISNPANPEQLTFITALDKNYHGEGAHVITFPDGRDMLAVNNEICISGTTTPPDVGGGFDLYDVIEPERPAAARARRRRLRRRREPRLLHHGRAWRRRSTDRARLPLRVHVARRRARSTSSASTTTSRRGPTSTSSTSRTRATPVAVARVRPRRRVRLRDGDGYATCRSGRQPARHNLHDMVVKEIDGVPTLLASYWDGGYVLLDVERSGVAAVHRRHDLRRQDPLTGMRAAERQRPPGRVLARQQVHPRRRRGSSARTARSPRSTRAAPDEFEFARLGRSVDDGPDRSRRDAEFIGRHRLRRQRLHRGRRSRWRPTRRRSPSIERGDLRRSRSRSRTPTPAATTAW